MLAQSHVKHICIKSIVCLMHMYSIVETQSYTLPAIFYCPKRVNGNAHLN